MTSTEWKVEFKPKTKNLVEPTVLISDPLRSAVREIESSKYEDVIDGRSEWNDYDLPELLSRKDRAMFNRVGLPSTSTVTVIAMETYVVTKAINPVTSVSSQLAGVLICVPPGLVVCA
ncbi:hypothetical protein DAPPUDRAFT_264553 [Daphnia pulex]|uniref:Uncharacterized protein n=1 Tax=Daphnia pulex TaxID=6669 RepID=E9HRU1_DAPPU|nr:hypothetical protein DAPPUDRAFT_264553 [Daphnia pulex]|eukprot:EFX65539.1 hypothetical protein DAPPUDRAFT_264553 [Daphnia pulex]